ncbi:hypothetical protein C8R45DRAFT_1102200 [Mycena sanguinolenta]|nr:hypothetical protein C8R45DRAFT_1102200 [Mycena sanguinolenta]
MPTYDHGLALPMYARGAVALLSSSSWAAAPLECLIDVLAAVAVVKGLYMGPMGCKKSFGNYSPTGSSALSGEPVHFAKQLKNSVSPFRSTAREGIRPRVYISSTLDPPPFEATTHSPPRFRDGNGPGRGLGTRRPSSVGRDAISGSQDYTPRSRGPGQRWTLALPAAAHREQLDIAWSSYAYAGAAASFPLLGTSSTTPPDTQQRAGVPRLAGMPDPSTPWRPIPIPLPPQLPGVTSVTLHPALRAYSGTHLEMDFGVASRSPRAGSNAASRWHTHHDQYHDLSSAPATSPALPSLTIESPRLPWVITAHASGRVARFLTVADVIAAISDALGLEVDEEGFEDWEVMAGSESRGRPNLKSCMKKGESLRYRSGMMRLDLLEGKTKFVGLSESAMGCDHWVLEVA